jgi:hypothetical protein
LTWALGQQEEADEIHRHHWTQQYICQPIWYLSKKFSDFRLEDIKDKDSRASDMVEQGLTNDCGIAVTPESTLMWRLLGGLDSHDRSVMHEVLGMPTAVLGASLGSPFWK